MRIIEAAVLAEERKGTYPFYSNASGDETFYYFPGGTRFLDAVYYLACTQRKESNHENKRLVVTIIPRLRLTKQQVSEGVLACSGGVSCSTCDSACDLVVPTAPRLRMTEQPATKRVACSELSSLSRRGDYTCEFRSKFFQKDVKDVKFILNKGLSLKDAQVNTDIEVNSWCQYTRPLTMDGINSKKSIVVNGKVQTTMEKCCFKHMAFINNYKLDRDDDPVRIEQHIQYDHADDIEVCGLTCCTLDKGHYGTIIIYPGGATKAVEWGDHQHY